MRVLFSFYRYVASPLLHSIDQTCGCKYIPTCSQYLEKAVAIHGGFRGTWLGIKRVMSCHPFSPGGYDSVPEKKLN